MKNCNLVFKVLCIHAIILSSCYTDISKNVQSDIDGHWYLVDIQNSSSMDYFEMKITEHIITDIKEGRHQWQKVRIPIAPDSIMSLGANNYKIKALTSNSLSLGLNSNSSASFDFKKLLVNPDQLIIKEERFRRLIYEIRQTSLNDKARVDDLKHELWEVVGGAVDSFDVDEIILR